MKKLLLSLALLLPMLANAYEVVIDDTFYNLDQSKTEASLVNGRGFSGDVVIPESVTYEGVDYAVVTIESRAFYNCHDLTSVVIPSSVTTIGEYNQEIKGETNVEVISVST